MFVDCRHGHVISVNLGILSRPSLVELFSRSTKFSRGSLSHLSIEEDIEKGLKKFVLSTKLFFLQSITHVLLCFIDCPCS
jgi:hypothetical protein